MFIKTFPDEIDLLAFFESDPVFQDVADLHFAYKFTDADGVSIIFSFSATSGWIQAVIEYNGREVSRYLMEGVESFKIEKDLSGEYLISEVELEDTRGKVEVRISPFVSAKFSTLIR